MIRVSPGALLALEAFCPSSSSQACVFVVVAGAGSESRRVRCGWGRKYGGERAPEGTAAVCHAAPMRHKPNKVRDRPLIGWKQADTKAVRLSTLLRLFAFNATGDFMQANRWKDKDAACFLESRRQFFCCLGRFGHYVLDG